MAGRGFPPGERRTRERDNLQVETLVKDGKRRGPNLPHLMKNGKRVAWHPQTLRWFEHWRTSPQAIRMATEVDWDYLIDTALMHHEMWSTGRWELAAELRLRVANFGATPADRARLRIEVSVSIPPSARKETPESSGNVASLDDRRNRLAN